MRKNDKKRLNAIKRKYSAQRSGVTVPPTALNDAAQEFHLNLFDHRQRQLLLFALAELAFGKDRAGRKRGSKSTWTGNKLIELAHIDELYCYDKISDREIAKKIADKHKAQFRIHSTDAIRLALPHARLMLELWREKILDTGPPEGWNEDDGDDRRDELEN